MENSLDTPRTLLRWFKLQDLDELAAILAMPEVMRFSLNGPYSGEQTLGFLRRFLDQYKAKGYGPYAVIHKAHKKLIGFCGYLDQVVDGVEEVEIGYRLHPDYWNQGLATETVIAVRDNGFKLLGFRRMISIIEAENQASVRVALKCGLELEKETWFHDRVPVRIYSTEN